MTLKPVAVVRDSDSARMKPGRLEAVISEMRQHVSLFRQQEALMPGANVRSCISGSATGGEDGRFPSFHAPTLPVACGPARVVGCPGCHPSEKLGLEEISGNTGEVVRLTISRQRKRPM